MNEATTVARRLLRALGVSSLVLMGLISCGGGSSGTGDGSGSGTPGSGTPGSGAPGSGSGGSAETVINPGVSGTLFMSSPDSFVEFDLPTGISRVMRPDGLAFSASLDGQEFVLTNPFVVGLDPSDDREEVVFFGRDGRSSSRFLKSDGFSGVPLLSPNKQYVLVEWHSLDFGDEGGVSVPTVFARDGSIVRRFAGYRNEYAWFPNGDILLTQGNSLYRTHVTGTAAPQLIATPGETPRGLTVSTDGSRIAFTIGNYTLHENTAWIINANGTGLRQVATSAIDGDGVAPHSFSPDDQQLLVSAGVNYVAVGPGYGFSGCAELYVVPLNLSSPVALHPDNPAPAIKLRSVVEDSGEVNSKACAFAPPSWRAMPELPAFTAGTAAQGDGLNRGLTGRAWFGFAGDVYRSDLHTGATVLLASAGNTPFVSSDGTEVVVLDRFAPSDPSDEAVLILNSETGAQKSRIDHPGDFSTPIKLSPDKTKLASDYVNLDAGDPGGATIVTVFSRDLSQVIARWNGARSWDWLPDGRLLLANVNEIHTTDATLRQNTKIATLPDPISGITISRDGARIAFTMNGNIWMTAGDGTGLVQLTHTGRLLRAPQFSPDGRYVLAESVYSPYQTWVVPVDGVRVPVHNRAISNTSAFPLQMVDVESGTIRLMFASEAVNWR